MVWSACPVDSFICHQFVLPRPPRAGVVDSRHGDMSQGTFLNDTLQQQKTIVNCMAINQDNVMVTGGDNGSLWCALESSAVSELGLGLGVGLGEPNRFEVSQKVRVMVSVKNGDDCHQTSSTTRYLEA